MCQAIRPGGKRFKYYLGIMKQTHDPFRFTYAVLVVPLSLLLLIWTVYLAEVRLGVNLNHYGVFPRTLRGLRGILFGPMVHGSLNHLYHNSIPLVILSAALFYFYRKIAWKTLLLGLLITGAITWLIGRPSNHIGASGVIYMLAGFIFFKGVFSRHYRLIALSLAVVFLYGGMLWYVFPIKDGISWEGHLGGAIAGFLLAVTLRSPLPARPKYAWEHPEYREDEDPFMRHFDKDGNFIEDPETGEGEGEGIQVRYHYREKPRESQ